MITITSQLVHPTGSPEAVGVNLYLYHSDHAVPEDGQGKVDLAAALQQTRTLLAWNFELKPGGNNVLAFLEIVLRERSVDAFNGVVRLLKNALGQFERFPIGVSNAHAAAHMNITLGLEANARRMAILETLVESCTSLLENALVPVPGPLLIRVRIQPGGVVFSLDQASLKRVSDIRQGPQIAPSISISIDTYNDFETMIGPLLPHMAVMVTRLDEETLLREGGVRFVGEDGHVIRDVLVRQADA